MIWNLRDDRKGTCEMDILPLLAANQSTVQCSERFEAARVSKMPFPGNPVTQIEYPVK